MYSNQNLNASANFFKSNKIALDQKKGWYVACFNKSAQGAVMKNLINSLSNEQGKAGYILAWILGVPASVLFIIYIVFN